MIIDGTIVRKFGDSINTDYIIPAYLLQESWDDRFFAAHAFEKFDPEFTARCSKQVNNIVVAGRNFGCGSSREQAVYALKFNNVAAIIALSYPDIFYRNSLNNGLPLFRVEDVSLLSEGDEVTINTDTGTVHDRTGGTEIMLSDTAEELEAVGRGGTLGFARNRLLGRLIQ